MMVLLATEVAVGTADVSGALALQGWAWIALAVCMALVAGLVTAAILDAPLRELVTFLVAVVVAASTAVGLGTQYGKVRDEAWEAAVQEARLILPAGHEWPSLPRGGPVRCDETPLALLDPSSDEVLSFTWKVEDDQLQLLNYSDVCL